MKIAKPKKILNPYDWLPGFGESRVAIRSDEGLRLYVDIYYEKDKKQQGDLCKKTIVFSGVRGFLFGSAPMSDLTRFSYPDSDEFKTMLGSLVEYESSEAVQVLKKSRFLEKVALKHYEIFFLSANESLRVFGEGCYLES